VQLPGDPLDRAGSARRHRRRQRGLISRGHGDRRASISLLLPDSQQCAGLIAALDDFEDVGVPWRAGRVGFDAVGPAEPVRDAL